MKSKIITILLNEYANCKKCGSNRLGPGYGELNIKDKTFSRSCACGWSVEEKEVRYETTERQIRLLLQEINTNIPKEQLKINLVMRKLLEVRKIVKEK